MKKIIFILAAILGLVFTSCDPLEDTYNEIEVPYSNDISGDVEFTMSNEDYEAIDNDDVSYNKSFESLDQAKELIPALLDDKYAGLGFNSIAKVNYGYNRSISAAEIPADEKYTVTDADYTAQGGDVAQYGNFSSAEHITAFLDTKYPAATEDFLVLLTYDYYDNGTKTITSSYVYENNSWVELLFELNENYEVTTQDYTAQGGDVAQYGNFSSTEQINAFLNSKYTKSLKNTVVKLTYKYYSDGATTDVTNIFQYNGIDTWTQKEGELLTYQAYIDMGEGYANFSNQEEAEVKLPIYLKNTFDQYAVAGDIYEYIYEIYNSSLTGTNSTEYTYVYLEFDGANWNLTRNNIPASLGFKHNGEVWVPDNTIKYIFSSEDYDFVVAQFSGVPDYESAVSNLDSYGNFNTNNWDDDMMLAVISKVLLNSYPSAEIGQKFDTTYIIYNGGTTTEEKSVILEESGEYVYQ